MSRLMNIYASQMTPKQKKELLGIYEDYLYFQRGMELVLKNNSAADLSYMLITKNQWETLDGQVVPWKIEPITAAEREAYVKFVKGQDETGDKYSYISLYHINEEEDANLPKVKYCSDKYSETTIDLDLPCPVERYDVAYIKNQKMKDAILLIDGKFHIEYTGERYKDMFTDEALNNPKMQVEFRIMLQLADYYDFNKNKFDYRYTEKEIYAHFGKLMTRITAAEALSEYENKILDLMGMYASKAQEAVRGLFPKKNTTEAWQAAEKEGLISSAENMRHYLNIRHLLRHQWDSLDSLGNFSPGNSKEHENVRKEYIKSYRMFFDKTLHDRIKEYQNVAKNMQTLLTAVYPDFLVRETGESNSKFVKRLKEWQKENPELMPTINTNYPLMSEKYESLISNISKVLPEAQIADSFKAEDYQKNNEKENGYFNKTWYLGLYNHIESNMMTYCWTRGLDYTRNNTWYYFKKNILSREEYDKWCKFRLLRNNLSHNHLDAELRADLKTAVDGDFGEYVLKMGNFLRENTPQFIKQTDGTFLAVHNDGLRVVVDMEKMTVLSCTGKDSKEKNNNQQAGAEKYSKQPASVTVRWWEGKIVDCRLPDGIFIDLKRQKICFPDESRIHFDREGCNFFRMGYNDMYTDKTFEVTKYFEKGKYQEIGRNENRVIAPGHRLRTDNKSRVAEDIISLSDGRKLNISFTYGSDGAIISLPDGTKLNVSAGKFEVSHNGIVLNYENRHAFRNSYETQTAPLPVRKIGNER